MEIFCNKKHFFIYVNNKLQVAKMDKENKI